ncbi:MAG: hypothetical protein O7A04_11470 [Acidobacteria bacterium]|nr:hypothetical protein [Acidobacteriota bacterium]
MAHGRQEVIQAAEKLVARGRIQAAIDEYRKVLDRHPNDTSTLNRVGDLYARLNRMQQAIDLFRKTAESFGGQGFFVKAIAIYKKIIRLEPGQISAYQSLADLYNRQGLTGDSLAQYQVVADYYEKHDDIDAALGVYHDMVEIEPNNPTRRLQLAGLLQKAGSTAQALDQYYEIASLMLVHSRGEDALRVLAGALDVDDQNLDFVRQAMQALQDGGFDRLAEKFLDAAAAKNPQANALRLDKLEEKPTELLDEVLEGAGQAPKVEAESGEAEPPAAVEVEVETEVGEAEPPAAIEAEAEVETESTAEPMAADVELSELEEIPVADEIDHEVRAPEQAVAGIDEELVIDLDVPEVGSEFMLEDVEPATVDEATVVLPVQDDAAPTQQAVAEEEDLGFELDVDEVSAQLVEATDEVSALDDAASSGVLATETEPEPEAEAEPEPERESQPEAELVETPSAAVGSMRSDLEITGESIKLLIEAEVLSRYGMNETAIAVLERVLQGNPRHTEAMARLARLQLKDDHKGEALALANQLADIMVDEGAPQSWDQLCETMAECGFLLAEGRFVAGVSTQSDAQAEAGAAAEPAPEAVDEAAEVDPGEQSLEDIVADAATLSRPKPKAAALATEDVLAEVIEEIERGEQGRSEPPAAVPAEVVAEREDPKSDLEWLREPESADADADEQPELPAEDFVDLATELEAELIEEGGLDGDLLPNVREQSLEDIVEGFRQGMAETLSDEDYDTHHNLGVAYREMGLIDEAIGEFQLAAKDPRFLVESCSLLASCFVDKNFFDLAVQWYERGLESSAIDEGAKLGLLYELGTLLAATGGREAARERFLEIYGINSNYRDIVAKLEEFAG